MHLNHDEYYRDRLTERDLCYDFPGDEILIDGLHAMQCHFWNHNVQIDIPVVQVMNAAHFLAAYMFATTCSGDQGEYDVLAYCSIGHDKRLVSLTMIVLAAMLERTKGFRARNCRNVIIANRDNDFEEGLTLYERFLRSAEKRFDEESFLIDIPALVAQNKEKDAIIAQQQEQIIKLQYTITTMENQLTQINIGTQNNNYGTVNYNYYTVTSAPQAVTPEAETTTAEEPTLNVFCRITDEARKAGKAQAVENELRSACISAPKLIKAIRTNEALGYLDTQNLSSKDLYELLDEHFHLPFTRHNFTVYRSK